MKIGILTFWYTDDNYGQVLQLYALQKYLKETGHSPFIIRYDNRLDSSSKVSKRELSLKRIVHFMLRIPSRKWMEWKLNRTKHETIRGNKLREFDRFRQEHISFSDSLYSSLAELQSNPPQADIYICGSDVIWKETIAQMAYFLDFGSEIKRVAYAPSFGTSSISDSYGNLIQTRLQKFDLITTRERSGVDICESIGLKAGWVADPAFLLSASCYKKLAVYPVSGQAYAMVYLLGHKMELSLGQLFSYLKDKGLEIYYVAAQSQNDKYAKQYATFESWLGAIEKASCVVTNSFHCCVMAIIMKKKFMYIPLSGSSQTLNERLYSLFDLLKLRQRVYAGSFSIVEEDIEWAFVDKALDRFTESSKILLNEALR